MPRKKETLTLSVPPGTKEKLDAIAARLNIKWGDRPSSSGLISAIAQSKLYIGDFLQITPQEVRTLHRAILVLIDVGQVELAKSVITLLLNHGHIEAPLRQELFKIASHPLDGWRMQVNQYVEQRQPFRVSYGDGQGKLWEFTVRHAEIEFYEKRYYLQIWCDETDLNVNLPELQHHRCLRFDRIQGLLEAAGEWRGYFDSIQVQLKFKGNLVQAYEAKPDDISDELVDGDRLVSRTVVNPFWLLREVHRYGADCEIISPGEIRQSFRQELLKTLNQYD
jgi:predicted DNA-binding transcriptional regulator YafY